MGDHLVPQIQPAMQKWVKIKSKKNNWTALIFQRDIQGSPVVNIMSIFCFLCKRSVGIQIRAQPLIRHDYRNCAMLLQQSILWDIIFSLKKVELIANSLGFTEICFLASFHEAWVKEMWTAGIPEAEWKGAGILCRRKCKSPNWKRLNTSGMNSALTVFF